MSDKPKVLFVWGYHRGGWKEIPASVEDYFDINYLFFINPTYDSFDGPAPAQPCFYWEDFKSATVLLKRIGPKVVVFMGIDSLYSVALNRGCQRAGVPTAFLQHGLFLNLEAHKASTQDGRRGRWQARPLSFQERLNMLLFFLRSSGFLDWQFCLGAIRWQALRRREQDHIALAKCKFPGRIADRYIVHAIPSAEGFFQERDGVGVERMVETGNPLFDQFFKVEKRYSLPGGEPYDLLIDQALSGGPSLHRELKSVGEMIVFYERLAAYSAKQGRRLVVKLHPFATLPDQPMGSVVFIHETDGEEAAALVRGAQNVYGFYSTLLLPALCLKPCCLFRVRGQLDFYRIVEDFGIAPVVDFDADPQFHEGLPQKGLIETFSRYYLYRLDGESTSRLRRALTDMICEARSA